MKIEQLLENTSGLYIFTSRVYTNHNDKRVIIDVPSNISEQQIIQLLSKSFNASVTIEDNGIGMEFFAVYCESGPMLQVWARPADHRDQYSYETSWMQYVSDIEKDFLQTASDFS